MTDFLPTGELTVQFPIVVDLNRLRTSPLYLARQDCKTTLVTKYGKCRRVSDKISLRSDENNQYPLGSSDRPITARRFLNLST